MVMFLCARPNALTLSKHLGSPVIQVAQLIQAVEEEKGEADGSASAGDAAALGAAAEGGESKGAGEGEGGNSNKPRVVVRGPAMPDAAMLAEVREGRERGVMTYGVWIEWLVTK